MTYLYELLPKSQLFDLHHLETKKMTQAISLDHENAFSVNFINIGIFLSSGLELHLSQLIFSVN